MFGFNGPIAAGGLSYSPSNPQASMTSPLVNTASSYPYPATSGLLGALSAPAGTPDYSQMALQMAQGGGSNPGGGLYPSVGAPNANTGGLYPSVPVPPTTPGSVPSSGGGGATAAIGGLLAAVARNPGLLKGVTSAGKGLMSLLGYGSPAAAAAPAAASAAAPATAYGADLAAETAAPAAADAAAAPATAYGADLASETAAPAAAAATPAADAGAGLMGALGPALAVAAPLGILALGMTSKPYTMNSDYYGRMNSGLTAGLAPGATPQQQFAAAQWLGATGGNPGAGFGPDQWNLLAKYGVNKNNIGQFATNLMRSSSQAIAASGAPGGGGRGGGYASPV